MDLPIDPINIVQEYTIEPQTMVSSMPLDEMAEVDLSFYDTLAYGLCSGTASSRPRIII